MSIILDALKKSESDQQRQSGPALFEVRVAPPKARFPLWAIAIVALLVVNMLIVGYMLLRRSSHTDDAAVTGNPNAGFAQNDPAQFNGQRNGAGFNGGPPGAYNGGGAGNGSPNNFGPTGGPQGGTGNWSGGQGAGGSGGQGGNGSGGGGGGANPPNGGNGSAQGGGNPNWSAGQGTNGVPGQGGGANGFPGQGFGPNGAAGQGAQGGGNWNAGQGGGANGSATQGPNGAGGPTLANRARDAIGSETAPSGNPDDYAPASEPDSALFKGHVKRGTESGLPLYQDMAVVPGANLPQLRLDLHVYAAKPQDRFALINMHKMHEGDALPDGVRIENITPDGVILSTRNGSKFLLPRD